MIPDQLAELTATISALAALDPRVLTAGQMVDALEKLHESESRIRALQASWLEAADASDAIVDETGRSARSWLIEDQNMSAGEASRRMLLARNVSLHPQVQEAFAAGEISADHATTLIRAISETPPEFRHAVEGPLVELAKHEPPFLITRAIDTVLEQFGVERNADELAAARYAKRGVQLDETFGGTGSLSGTLSPETFETLRVAIDAASTPAGPDDNRTAAQRRHDGLGEIAAFYLAKADTADERGERPRVIVTMPYSMLMGELTSGVATLGVGLPLPAATARRMACDAGIIPAVLGGRGEVLDLGRSTPTFSLAIRRAAWLRDHGSCAYPRCRRRVMELHHIVWLSRGGPSSLENAAWLCAFHHWLVHEGGWEMRRDGATGDCVFTDKYGREHRHPPQPEAA